MKRSKLTALGLIPFFSLIGCAPADIPSDASRQWSLKAGNTWYWDQETANGCISWMGQEKWVSVELLLNTTCKEWGAPEFRDSQRLSYSSTTDEITFHGYWPWSSGIFGELIVFDGEGNWVEALPCPHSLPQKQINAMEVVASEALRHTKTDGERRVLSRIKERLAKTDGSALSSSQRGCSDRPLDPQKRNELGKVNPWRLA